MGMRRTVLLLASIALVTLLASGAALMKLVDVASAATLSKSELIVFASYRSGKREDSVEVELLDEGPAVPNPDFPENALEMVFYGVFGYVEGLGDLFGGGAANGQVDHFLLAGA
jgi:hypothetical protein